MRFEKSKPNRLHKQFINISVKNHWWVSINNKKFLIRDDYLDEFIKNKKYDYYSNGLSCATLRRFRKICKKFNIKKGTAILYNRFSGYNIYN